MSPAVATDAPATFHVVTLYGQVLYGQWTYGFDGQAAVIPTTSERLVTTAKATEVEL